jgi:hypothetical protein
MSLTHVRQGETWPGARLLLERAVSRVQHEAANGRVHPAGFGVNR